MVDRQRGLGGRAMTTHVVGEDPASDRQPGDDRLPHPPVQAKGVTSTTGRPRDAGAGYGGSVVAEEHPMREGGAGSPPP